MKNNSRKALFVSLMGNTLEYYEFSIFAVFAIQIGAAFFDANDEFTRILKTLMLFTAGFISRPLGSLIFGHIGDKFGRRLALIITITGMSLSTLGIAFVPSYLSIGVTAPYILLMLRLLQGLFIGGEGAGAAVYILENQLNYKSEVVGGILISANVAGILLASLVGIAINSFGELDEHNWRLAFIIGGVAGLIVSYFRISLAETERYVEMSPETKLNTPAVQLFSKYWREVLLVIAFGGFSSGVAYVIKGFLVIYFQIFMNLSSELAFTYLMFTSTVFAITPPFYGYISSFIKPRKFIQYVTLLIIFLFIPVFLLISSKSYLITLCGLFILANLAAAIYTPLYPYLMSMFPTEVRYSGIAISFNLGVTLIGGFTPIVSTYLIEKTGNNVAPAFYILGLAIVYLYLSHLFHKNRVSTFKSAS